MNNKMDQPETDTAALIRKITAQTPGDMTCIQHGCVMEPGTPLVFNGQTYGGHPVCHLCEQERKDAARDEEISRKMKAMGRRFSAMGIPQRYQGMRIKDFKCSSPFQEAVVDVAKRFCDLDIDWDKEGSEDICSRRESIRNLLFLGNVGTGKTLLSCGILTDSTHSENGDFISTGLYITASQLIRRIKSTWRKDSDESEQGVIDKLSTVDLLVVDEIGVQFSSETERMFLTEIINERYNKHLGTIISSNLTLAEFTNVVGDRVVDRLREGGKVCVFDWPSQRWGASK